MDGNAMNNIGLRFTGSENPLQTTYAPPLVPGVSSSIILTLNVRNASTEEILLLHCCRTGRSMLNDKHENESFDIATENEKARLFSEMAV
jgi:hypothetical protein